MSYNGNGVFNINTAGQPVVPGTVISSTAFNALTADLANGLTTAITKDGQTTPTSNIPMGGFRITGLGAAVATTDAVQYGQLQSNSYNNLTVSGVDVLTATANPALTAYTAGNAFYFIVGSTNTGAMTINIDALGVKDIRRAGSTALAAGDLVTGQTALIVYNGTNFQLLNSNAFTNLRVSGTLTGGSSVFTNSQITSLGVGTAASGTTGEIRATNNVTAFYSSDRKFKENVVPVVNALDKVQAIGTKTFDWTDEYIASKGGEDNYFIQKSDFGVIAQDVQAVFPEAVRTRPDGSLAVDYEKLGTLAFQAIIELTERVKALEVK
jgi:hypothetical protein